jgi:hypothetical protein
VEASVVAREVLGADPVREIQTVDHEACEVTAPNDLSAPTPLAALDEQSLGSFISQGPAPT